MDGIPSPLSVKATLAIEMFVPCLGEGLGQFCDVCQSSDGCSLAGVVANGNWLKVSTWE